MKIELKYLYSPDSEDFCEGNFKNANLNNLLIQALIGIKDQKGEESFEMIVCTKDWIFEELNKNKYIFGRELLIVNEINYQIISKIIKDLCDKIEGKSWEEISIKLCKYFKWEFENYSNIN